MAKNRIGILCDPYKTAKFESVLTKAGYKFEVTPGAVLTTIVVLAEPSHQPAIAKICSEVEEHYRKRNSNLN